MILAALVLTLFLIIFFGVLSRNDRSLLFQSAKSIEHDGTQRRYRLVLPDKYSPDTSYPLIVALHGFRDSGTQLGLYSGLSNLASEKGVIIVYPEGLEKSWNGQICCGYAYMNNVDDVGYITQLIGELDSQYAVDRNRRYLVGYSNGGLLVQRLIHERPDTFQGAAVVMAGAGDTEQLLDNSSANTPLLILHGENDRYVPVRDGDASGDGFSFASVSATIEHWKNEYKVTDELQEETDAYVRTEYTTQKAALQHIVYKNTGHTWPQWRITQPFQKVPNSTRHIWDFFESNNRYSP
jgi:polyhydroxybutyrate depolymerase